jgi:hypothetical protein
LPKSLYNAAVASTVLAEDKLQNCPECATPLMGKYCHQCGEKLPNAHDLTLKHFLHHGFHELTHLDSKIFRTLLTLLFKPGVLSAEYAAGRKQRYVLPLRLFLVIFALNLFLYTRPGIALYDIRFVLAASPQGKSLETRLEHSADKRHLTKDALLDQINEHWQHNVSLFQLGDVFFFALWLALINWGRYFGEHLIFSLHALSFSFLFSSVIWLYYARYGFRINVVLTLITVAVLIFYLWRAIPRMYGATGWNALLKSLLLVIGLEISRVFFVTLTMILAFIQTFRAH